MKCVMLKVFGSSTVAFVVDAMLRKPFHTAAYP